MRIRAALGTPTPDRLLKIAQAMRHGLTDEQIHTACKIDPWFLAKFADIVDTEAEIRAKGLPATPRRCAGSRRWDFPTRALPSSPACPPREVTRRGSALGVRPVFKRIDTCAAEFASPTAYMYSTYETPFAGAHADEASTVRHEEK